LPLVLHPALSGAQVPPLHTPPQHSPSTLHAPPSDVHWLPEHLKPTHENEQQSGPTEQSSFAIKQPPAPGAWTHVIVVGSHMPVQHSSFVAHAVPVAVHSGPCSAHAPEFGSQMLLQQSSFAAQGPATSEHLFPLPPQPTTTNTDTTNASVLMIRSYQ
jgi:hypothetical protein